MYVNIKNMSIFQQIDVNIKKNIYQHICVNISKHISIFQQIYVPGRGFLPWGLAVILSAPVQKFRLYIDTRIFGPRFARPQF